MTVPLCILAILAVGAGLAVGPTGLFAHFLDEHWMAPGGGAAHEHNYLLMGVSSLLALGGVALAFLIYVRQPGLADSLARTWSALYELSRNKFYLDEIF